MNEISEISLENFEPYLVNGIINDSSVFATISQYLPEKIFKNKNFAILVKTIRFFFKKYNKIPKKDEILLHNLSSETKAAIEAAYAAVEKTDYRLINKELFFNTAERFLKERNIWAAMVQTAAELDSGTANSSEILTRFEKICSISLDNDGGLDLYNNIDLVIDFLSKKQETISTGYSSIDRNIDGGMYKDGRALYMFMAPPNKGKSLFLGNIACNLANEGKNVLLVTLEMSEMAYAKRFCAQQASVPFAEIPFRLQEIRETLESKKGRIIIKEFPPSSITVYTLKAWIKKNLVDKGIEFDAIIIDYLNLFDGQGNNLYEKIKSITEQVRALSYDFNVPCISATQQNRTADGKSAAGLTSVSESSGIAMTADVLLEIYQDDNDAAMNYFRVGFAKNRYGPVNFSILTKVDFNTLRILDLDTEDNSYTASISGGMENSLETLLKQANPA